jgi:uncharacterized lipoprotein
MRAARVREFVLVVASCILLAGCSVQGDDRATADPSSSPAVERPLPEISLTYADLAACSAEPTKSRIDRALAQSTISPKNSVLALPQDMGTYEKAVVQMEAWSALSGTDRLYQLCFNYQQGSFGTRTPAP